MLLSDVCLYDVCLSRTSGVTREQRGLGRLKIAHVTRDSDTSFKVKRSKVRAQGHQAALVGCSSHYMSYVDDTMIIACRS